MDKSFGVIQEQGFVLGSGLGYKPITEEEKKRIDIDHRKDHDMKERQDT